MVTRAADAASPLRSEPDYTFDFCGGDPAVDFTNTVGSRGEDPAEHFHTAGDILAWGEARGVVSRRDGARARRALAANPDLARRAFRRAIELREALYAVFAAALAHRDAPADALAVVNTHVARLFSGARLAASAEHFTLETPSGEGLDVVLAPVIRAAIDLLTSDRLHRVGMCADTTCRWLFVDATRSGTRRWCDMKGCGNRNKVRRFRTGA